jgi:hypothetical protein
MRSGVATSMVYTALEVHRLCTPPSRSSENRLTAHRLPTRLSNTITRVRSSTAVDSPESSVIDSSIVSSTTVGVTTTSQQMHRHREKKKHMTYLAPPLALLKYEQISCEKQSCV